MADLVRVHVIEPVTWLVSEGYVNPDHIVTARPAHLDLAGVLCEACAERVASRSPALLALTLVGGQRWLILGDGRSDDAEAVRLARRLLKVRARCEQAQHREAEGVAAEEYQGMRSLHAPRS